MSCKCIPTDSAITDMIKEFFTEFKIINHPDSVLGISGEYYYKEIFEGIAHNKPIKIKINHISAHLKDHLEQLTENQLQNLMYRAITEYVASLKGSSFSYQAQKENRIKWTFE